MIKISLGIFLAMMCWQGGSDDDVRENTSIDRTMEIRACDWRFTLPVPWDCMHQNTMPGVLSRIKSFSEGLLDRYVIC